MVLVVFRGSCKLLILFLNPTVIHSMTVTPTNENVGL